MKLNYKQAYKTVMLMLFLFLAAPVAVAQTGFEDDVDDEPADVPAQPYVAAGLMIGAFAGYFLVKRQAIHKHN
jgi:hypothetical protein